MQRSFTRWGVVLLSVALATALVTFGPSQPATADRGDAIVERAVKHLQARPQVSRLGKGQRLTAFLGIADRDGSTHVRFRRTFNGLPVIGGDVVVHQTRAGALRGVTQTLRRTISVPTRARVTQRAAGRTALRAPANRGIAEAEVGEAELVVDALDVPRLAWKVDIHGVQADRTPSRIETYVDAQTGEVIRADQRIHTVDGTGQGIWVGEVDLAVSQSGSAYQLKDPSRGGTYTVSMNNQAEGPLCGLLGWLLKFFCPTESLVTSANGRFTDGAAVDAQYGMQVTWDYLAAMFGREGIFGTGKGLYARVHYDRDYNNAFWDGSRLTFGDGDGTNFGAFTSTDVVAHEMIHGLIEKTAALRYSGEPGGLNEATADIFGTMVEFYANNAHDPPDYFIGEQFTKKSSTGFRRMDHPGSDGKSPNCWTSNVKNLDVHFSSGVANHFFYLLAEGSGPKKISGVQHNSPTCNGATIAGIGRDKAVRIWYRALTVYMTSNTDYAGARVATLKAAGDLYGADSAEYRTVANAWTAVAVR